MVPLFLILAGFYVLPDADRIPAPDDAQRARIENALSALRTQSGDDVDRAVRDLALVGEPALPAIVRRLNEADAPERLLLLTATRRLARAAPLLKQAREDPHPAIRAWIAPRRSRPAVDLRRLAADYLDALAVAEEKLRRDADRDLAGLPRVARPVDTFERQRDRLEDRRVAARAQARRDRLARQFAVEGGLALRAGGLAPDLRDPVFVAYLGLLREEGSAFREAVTGLVAVGPPLAPALEPLLAREQHDPRAILRMLAAVRPDRGRGLFEGIERRRPDTQRALVVLAPRVLDGAALVALYERMALADNGSVRAVALDGLLALAPPAGRDVARKLLDLDEYGRTEFRRAARLLARAGELEVLERYAVLEIPDDGGERTTQLGMIRRAARAGLAEAAGPNADETARRLLAAERPEIRMLGLRLLRDVAQLLELAARTEDERLAEQAALRAVELHGAEAARPAVEALRARELSVPVLLLQDLRRRGLFDLLFELAADADPDSRRYAMRVLGDVAELDARYEARALALFDGAPASMRETAFGAILPVGTDAVRQRCLALGAAALSPLKLRVEQGFKLPWVIPLGPYLEGADNARLHVLAQIAEGMPGVEEGIFARLFDAWSALAGAARTGEGPESGVVQRQLRLLDALARSGDRASAVALLGRVVRGEIGEPELALAVLKAAARLAPPEELAKLVPLLRRLVAEEAPGPFKRPPPVDVLREHVIYGAINALAYARVPAALDALCDVLLDPGLFPAAADWQRMSWIPGRVCDALRFFPATETAPAMRRALVRAETDGRLAALQPSMLYSLAKYCRNQRRYGRSLPEVSVQLAETLQRLPWLGGDVAVQRTLSLIELGRYAEAAAAARADAAAKRVRGYTRRDGSYTPAYLEARAAMLDALAARDPAAIVAAEPGFDSDPILYYIGGWYLRFMLDDVAGAEQLAAEGVRRTAGLVHLHRDLFASVRNKQGRPREALELLDPDRVLPVKRNAATGRHLMYRAAAYLQLGDERAARHALENALSEDRRLVPIARRRPEFARFAKLFRQLDDEFYDAFFAIN